MQHQAVSIRIQHDPKAADGGVHQVHRDGSSALFYSLHRCIDVVALEGTDRPPLRRFPVVAVGDNPESPSAHVILDPLRLRVFRGWREAQNSLIKIPGTFHVGHWRSNKCDFPDHGYFNLWMIILLPSGSCTTAIQQTGLSIFSAANVTSAALKSLMAASKSSTSIATLVPSDDGFH